jgi:hypothetical protein
MMKGQKVTIPNVRGSSNPLWALRNLPDDEGTEEEVDTYHPPALVLRNLPDDEGTEGKAR